MVALSEQIPVNGADAHASEFGNFMEVERDRASGLNLIQKWQAVPPIEKVRGFGGDVGPIKAPP